jgi:indolepyruvate ferredoxin oxidoreductase
MDPRFIKDHGVETYTGNELILKGGLEAGMALLTGYPGSPVADVFEAAANATPYLKEHGILAQIANNEALSAARLNGAQMAGLRAITVMKSVGFHVAADALIAASMAKENHQGAGVIVIGDDPWSDTTQVPVDSRRLSDHLFIPVLEPATFQEVKDWIKVAFELSEEANLFIAYLLITYTAEGGGSVDVYPNQPPTGFSTINKATIDSSTFDVKHSIVLPPHTVPLEKETLEVKFPQLLKSVRQKGINQILPGKSKKNKAGFAFVTAGASYTYLEQALSEFEMSGKFPILKLGMTYPVDPEAIKEILKYSNTLVVVEEKRRFIESQVRNIVMDLYQSGELKEMPTIWGKTFPDDLKGFPTDQGLSPVVVMTTLAPLFEKFEISTPKVQKEILFIQSLNDIQVSIPNRTPSFCPGCPHRDSSSVFLQLVADLKDPEYMRKKYKGKPIDILFHGDAGCYVLLFMPPNGPLMHNYIGMGLGGGTGAGLSPFSTNKSVCFIGDSTFFHSGLAEISDSIKNNQDVLYVVLDNKTTAMTGHQPHPGMEKDLMGNPTFGQDIEKVLQGLTKGEDVSIARVNPENRDDYRKMLEEMILEDGVKFVVADKECGITYHRRKRKEMSRAKSKLGYLPKQTRINVNDHTCENCLECTRLTGCPGLAIEETLYGPKMSTDLSYCVSDMACVRIKACPAFEEITIVRTHKPAAVSLPNPELLPVPEPLKFEGDWRGYLAGVGGMGIGSSTAVLVRAALKHGYHVTFCDKKGIAIRNGGVYSQIIFSHEKKVVSPLMPQGKTNLLLGLDILEAVRGIDPRFNFRVGSKEFTHSVINTHKTATILTLMGKDDFSPAQLSEVFKKYTKSYVGADMSQIAQDYLGNKVFVNVMLLGVAFQKGLLPLTLKEMVEAIEESFDPRASNYNAKAFHLGRDLVLHPEKYYTDIRIGFQEVMEKKAKILGGSRSRSYLSMTEEFLKAWEGDEDTRLQFISRLYDLIEFDNIAYARKYFDRVMATLKKDTKIADFAATKAVVKYLHKVMEIKDEVYVAHLLTSPEKYEQDAKRYKVDLSSGDRIEYRHFNRPEFNVLGMKIEFDMKTRDWMLNLMKHMKFLRLLMPQWHQREKAFRLWFTGLVDQFNFKTPEEYDRWVKVLTLPEEVRGYRKIRYPKMEKAMELAPRILAGEELPSAFTPHRHPRELSKV